MPLQTASTLPTAHPHKQLQRTEVTEEAIRFLGSPNHEQKESHKGQQSGDRKSELLLVSLLNDEQLWDASRRAF